MACRSPADMKLKMSFTSSILAAIIFFLKLTSAEECEHSSARNSYIYPRILTVIHDGPRFMLANRSMASQVLSESCGDLDTIAEKMIKAYEVYDVDLETVRRAPYEGHETDKFDLVPIMTTPNHPHRIITTSLFDYSKFTDSDLYMITWLLVAKTNITGPEHDIPAGYWMRYGRKSFSMYGRDFCLEFIARTPVTWQGNPATGSVPIDVLVNDKDLGKGAGQGLSRRVGSGSLTMRYVITFPDTPP